MMRTDTTPKGDIKAMTDAPEIASHEFLSAGRVLTSIESKDGESTMLDKARDSACRSNCTW